MIRDVALTDAKDILDIYNHYVEKTTVTFEEAPIDEAEMRHRIADTTARYPWLIAEQKGQLQGYAYASQWQARAAYRYTAETTIYLHNSAHGKGVGTKLYGSLIEALRRRGLHSLVAGIALPNSASIALNEKLGFEKVAHFTAVGRKLDQWVDVGYWALLL